MQEETTEVRGARALTPPTRRLIIGFLEEILPGSSVSVRRLREQIFEFVATLTARQVLLLGPIGAGKSAVARLIGFLKRIAPLEVSAADRMLSDARFEAPGRLDLRLMPWYVELALTGLVDTLADSQLFGVSKGAFTGATLTRSGVFEQASTGRMPRGKEDNGSKLTGGVVFLDEIGDLARSIQPKLLPVLGDGVFYRVGGEGDPSHQLEFHGVTITASWKDLRSQVRPDLLSRISPTVIDVPGLADRTEDFDAILDSVESQVVTRARRVIKKALIVEPQLDREYWNERLESIAGLPPEARVQLQSVDWSEHGNLRGLTGAVEHVLVGGRQVSAVIDRLSELESYERETTPVGLLKILSLREADGRGLAEHLRDIEADQRKQLRDELREDAGARTTLAKRLGLSEQQLVTQIHQLGRRRNVKGRAG